MENNSRLLIYKYFCVYFSEKVASAQRELSALMKPLKCDLCNAVVRLIIGIITDFSPFKSNFISSFYFGNNSAISGSHVDKIISYIDEVKSYFADEFHVTSEIAL